MNYLIKYKHPYQQDLIELPDVYDNIEDAIVSLEGIIESTRGQYEWFIFDDGNNPIEFKFPFKKGQFYDINVLEGLTILKINVDWGADQIRFVTDKGTFKMYHEQNCCECVRIEDICGTVDDLIDTPCLSAYSTSNEKSDIGGDERWTFYHIRTIKGTVTLRWYGESNGYYSVGVDFQYI